MALSPNGLRPVRSSWSTTPSAVDVAGRGHRLSEELLRRGILRRQQPQPGSRQRCGVSLAAEELRDAEVQQLHGALLGHQDVGRLDVPVDDQLLMGVLHRLAYREEERQPAVDAEPVGVGSIR